MLVHLLKITTFVFTVFLSSLLFGAYAAEKGIIFTKTETKNNCTAYMRELLKKEPPTLVIYRKYYSRHDESEYDEELNFCNHNWGRPYECRDGKVTWDSKCSTFIQKRWSLPEKTHSFYLLKIQKIIHTYTGEFKITDIQLKIYDKNFADYIVSGLMGETQIEFRHAASEWSWDLFGLVSILTIDNKKIDELIGFKTYRSPGCP